MVDLNFQFDVAWELGIGSGWELAVGRWELTRAMTHARGSSYLFVAEAIRGPIQTHQVHALWIRPRETAVRDHSIARLQRVGCHALADQLVAIVHLEPPLERLAALADVDDQKRMRVDELELADGAGDGHLFPAVVDRGNRMMGGKRDGAERPRRRQ